MTTVFIAADRNDFSRALVAEKVVRDMGAEALNPTVSLPCHLAECCYLPIELAMLEASDILWIISNHTPETTCLIQYAFAQNITIINSEIDLARELAKYEGSKSMQISLECFNEV